MTVARGKWDVKPARLDVGASVLARAGGPLVLSARQHEPARRSRLH